MDNAEPTGWSGGAKLAAVFATAALALPGGMLVSDALAAESGTSESAAPTQLQEVQQNERPEDCPERQGENGASGSGSGSGSSSGGSSDSTAYGDPMAL